MCNLDEYKLATPPQFEGDAPTEDTQCEVCGEMNFESDIINTELGEDDEEVKMCPDCYNAWIAHSGTNFEKFKSNWKQ